MQFFDKKCNAHPYIYTKHSSAQLYVCLYTYPHVCTTSLAISHASVSTVKKYIPSYQDHDYSLTLVQCFNPNVVASVFKWKRIHVSPERLVIKLSAKLTARQHHDTEGEDII